MKFIHTRNSIFVLFAFAFIFTFIFTFAACSDDSDFDGRDNFITSFELVSASNRIVATVANNSINAVLPESFLTDAVSVTLTVSENARISPDPSGIKDWSVRQTFVVTAHNGANREYIFTPEIDYSVVLKQNIVLRTQAEVEAFGTQKITALKGNLTIGAASGTDSIKSLAALSSLKSIDYELTINPTCAVVNMQGLSGLNNVGSLKIGNNKVLKNIDFPSLKLIALDLSITNQYATSLNFPVLKSVGNTFEVSNATAVAELHFPELEAVEGSYTLERLNNYTDHVVFPKLKNVGGRFDIQSLAKTEQVSFPELVEAGDVALASFSKAKSISLPKLATANQVLFNYHSELTNLEVPLLKAAENLHIESNSKLTSVNFSALETVAAEVYISGALLTDMSGFGSLKSVGGYLMLSRMTKLVDMDGLSKLESVKTLFLDNLSALQRANLNNLKTEKIEINNSAPTSPIQFVGGEVMGSVISIYNSNVEISGVKELGGLDLSSLKGNNIAFDSIEKVSGKLQITLYGVNGSFDMLSLKEVGSDLFVNTEKATELRLPNLAKVGGVFTFQLTSNNVFTLSLPALNEVTKDFILYTGYSSYYGLKDFSFPSLTIIGGKLLIAPMQNTALRNETIKNMDGFSALASVGSVEIIGQTLLSSFAGFNRAIPSLSSEGWKMNANLYNPTYAQMQAGENVNP